MKNNEKAMLDFEKYLNEHMEDGKSIEEVGKEFMELYNHQLLPEREQSNEELAQDLFYEVENCTSEAEVKKLLKKVLKLDPENLDALLMGLDYEDGDFETGLASILSIGEKKMKEKGYCEADAIGHYWGIIETRPFMRIKRTYLDCLMEKGKFQLALTQAKDILRLCEHDNLGVRYVLLTLYARLQQYEEAQECFDKWDEPSAFMYLPLIVLKLQLNMIEDAKKDYIDFQGFNKNCKKVFKKKGINIEKLEECVYDEMYAPYSEAEIYLALNQNIFLLMENMEEIMDFFVNNLVKNTTKKDDKKVILH